MAKTYDPIETYLRRRPGPTETLTFARWEQLTGVTLPPSARQYRPWWANDRHHVQARAWLDAGWRVAPGGVDMAKETVVFERVPPLETIAFVWIKGTQTTTITAEALADAGTWMLRDETGATGRTTDVFAAARARLQKKGARL